LIFEYRCKRYDAGFDALLSTRLEFSKISCNFAEKMTLMATEKTGKLPCGMSDIEALIFRVRTVVRYLPVIFIGKKNFIGKKKVYIEEI
jgi:hypothetical protein